MSAGVQITGLVKPLAGSFPVWEDIDGFGGWRTVATNAARDAIIAGDRKEGMVVYSIATQCWYSMNADLSTWSFLASSALLGLQAAWFVDQAAGNDNNDGKTSGTALKTITELCLRLCPNGVKRTFSQSTTITLLAGTYNEELALNVDFLPSIASQSQFVSVQGALSSVTATLTAVVNTNSGTLTSGELTVATTPFSAKCRIRSVTGAAAGAIAYSTGLHAGAGNTYCSTFYNYNTGVAVNIANGTDVAVDTLLTTVRMANLLANGRGYLEIKDIAFSAGAVASYGQFPANQVFFWGCALGAGKYSSANQATYVNCTSGTGFFDGGSHAFYGHVFTGVMTAGFTTPTQNTCIELRGADTIDGGKVNVTNGKLIVNTPLEGVNGGGNPALALSAGCFALDAGGEWGRTVNTSNFSFVWANADGSSYVGIVAAILTTNFPATNPIQLGARTFLWTDLPISLPTQGIVFSYSPNDAQAGVFSAQQKAPTAFAANVAAANLVGPVAAGLYRLEANIVVTAGGTAGAAAGFNAIFTDAAGAATVAVCTFDSTAVGRKSGALVFRSTGAAALQFSITGVTTPGALAATYEYTITRIN